MFLKLGNKVPAQQTEHNTSKTTVGMSLFFKRKKLVALRLQNKQHNLLFIISLKSRHRKASMRKALHKTVIFARINKLNGDRMHVPGSTGGFD